MKNMKERYGNWALVTGGTAGIGAALVDQLAADGLNIVLAARTQTKLDEQAAKIRSNFNVEVRTVAVDLTIPEDTQKLIDSVKDLEIGVLIPNAAVENTGYFVETSIERQQALVQLDVTSPMTLTHYFGAKMAGRRRGAILLVSSISGWMAQPYMAGYGAAKSYILALGAALYQEMKDKGVDVSVLSPGPTKTAMLESAGLEVESMGMKVMDPSDVARAGLQALGSRPDAIPGARNRMMVHMMTRVLSRRAGGAMFRKMLGKVLGVEKNSASEAVPAAS